MCTKQQNESNIAYICRLLIEQPRTVLAMVALAACGILYTDFRGLLEDQKNSQTELVRVLTELSARIENLEKKMIPQYTNEQNSN